jgi:hypothetical protein
MSLGCNRKMRMWRGSSFVLKHAATWNERIMAQSSDVDLFSVPGFPRIARCSGEDVQASKADCLLSGLAAVLPGSLSGPRGGRTGRL